MAANDPMIVAAVLVAAGSGSRLGAEVPKAFCPVRGRPLLQHAAQRFLAHDRVRDVVVVAPGEWLQQAAELVPAARVVAGGAVRQESVHRGLAALAEDVEVVLVHDVARPFVPLAVIDRVVAAVEAGAAAAIPAVPVTDTVKRVDPAGRVVQTLERAALRAVQTPQGFRRSILDAAHALGRAGDGADPATDDAALVEALGHPVVVVDGADESFKITRPWDLRLAEVIAGD